MWTTYAAAGLAVVVVYPLLPPGVMQDVAAGSVGLSAAVAVVVGVLVHRPRRTSAWVLIALGQVAGLLGDAFHSLPADGTGSHPSFLADVGLYAASYVFLFLGLGSLVRSRSRGADLAGRLDSALVVVSLALVSWLVLAGPVARDADLALVDRVVGVAYPAADIVLLAMLVRFLFGPGSRTAAYWLLVAGAGLLFAGDTSFSLVASSWTDPAGWLDLVWLASYVAWGTAALHPSMRLLSEPGPDTPGVSRGRVVAFAFGIVNAPALLIVQLLLGRTDDLWPVAVASIVLAGLVSARMALTMHQVRASMRSRDMARNALAFSEAYDALTHVASRAHTVGLVGAALERSRRSGALVGVLSVDIDQFKAINDAYGHAAGDEVLRVTAQRMRDEVRAGDTLGRIGGDEFVGLAETPGTEDDVVHLAERLLAAAVAPVEVAGSLVPVSVTIGIAVARGDDLGAQDDADAFLFEADVAVHRAKAAGGARVEIYDDTLRAEHRERIDLERAIRTALVEGQFALHYQPIVDALSRRVVGYEALLRWDRPGHGFVPPDAFIPVAELSELICDVDRWVLREATREAASGHLAVDQGVTVAVNVSGRHMAGAGVLPDVRRALADSGLAAERLVVEITETVVLDRPAALGNIEALRALGVGISIDDFGTGYTSIAQLQHLPVDSLKIDRGLVASDDPGTVALVRLIVHAAHSFGVTVIGEGVETERQLEALALSGCDTAQGYLIARPLPASAIRASVVVHDDEQAYSHG